MQAQSKSFQAFALTETGGLPLGRAFKRISEWLFKEDDTGNADETHFVIDFDNGQTMGFAGDQEVKYADAISGVVGMTMVVRISGGRDARIEPPFMVFKNDRCPYPIRGLPDDIPGVSYRSGPGGWMYTTVMP